MVKIKTIDAKGVTKPSKVWKEMENLLLIRIKDKYMNGDSVSNGIICEKVSQVY